MDGDAAGWPFRGDGRTETARRRYSGVLRRTQIIRDTDSAPNHRANSHTEDSHMENFQRENFRMEHRQRANRQTVKRRMANHTHKGTNMDSRKRGFGTDS